MASAQVVPSVALQVSYASLTRRVVAHLIDGAIALAVTFSGGLLMRWLRVLGVWNVPVREGETDPIALWHGMTAGSKVAILVAFIVCMGLFYSGLFQSSAWQATIGKRLLNIYVTDTAGRRIGLLRSLARSFSKSVFDIFYLGIFSVVLIMGALEETGAARFRGEHCCGRWTSGGGRIAGAMAYCRGVWNSGPVVCPHHACDVSNAPVIRDEEPEQG